MLNAFINVLDINAVGLKRGFETFNAPLKLRSLLVGQIGIVKLFGQLLVFLADFFNGIELFFELVLLRHKAVKGLLKLKEHLIVLLKLLLGNGQRRLLVEQLHLSVENLNLSVVRLLFGVGKLFGNLSLLIFKL